LAAPILDLANFLMREKLVPQHPATEVAEELVSLLGELVQTLLRLEERPDQFGDSPQELSLRVARGVALAVSLCDALAFIGNKEATGKLYQALRVGHRRLRTEAAAALARLGEEQGATELAQLAAEPIARLRVLAYANELGIMDKVEPEYATKEARAEAELCVWLAEPTQYGVPPTSCELFDHRQQHWPGFDQPVDCFLFQFQYVVEMDDGEKSFSNIGIAGPLVHAFVGDLGDLPAEDIYAAFAGWHAQHEDIREFDVVRLSKSEQLEVERLKRRLNDEGYTAIEPQRMGYFFGEKALIAAAKRQGVAGVAVADFHDTLFFPQRHSRRPLGPDEAYSIYKGRKLLKAFNR
ncbi:MAG TPA: HEAT repeat domain-containing protein, partial [Pirellulaceae bacterium]|nr:HEAT repeat domain-containing protein [Pirellulaceae bacterium]